MVKITEHFTAKEIFPSYPIINLESTVFKIAVVLCQEVLEPLRKHIGKPMIITSGHRTEEDYRRLVDKGYKPSKRSDHFYGGCFFIGLSNVTLKDIGTGAVDFVVKDEDMEEIFNDIINITIKNYGLKHETLPIHNKILNDIQIGQFILEKQYHNGVLKKWIHVSNSPENIYKIPINKYETRIFIKESR